MIVNPAWQREINISKIRLEVAVMDLQMEFMQGASIYNNGAKNAATIRGAKGRQSVDSGEEIRDLGGGDNAGQRDQEPDGGTNY